MLFISTILVDMANFLAPAFKSLYIKSIIIDNTIKYKTNIYSLLWKINAGFRSCACINISYMWIKPF